MKKTDARRGSFLDKGRKNKGWVCFLILNFSFLIFSGAVFSASLFLEPSDGDLILDCPNPIQIRLDTNGKSTSTSEVKLIENSTLPITHINSKDAVFSTYIQKTQSKIREGTYKGQQATYIMGSNSAENPYAGRGVFATIYVTPKATGNGSLKFYTIPNSISDDSNILQYKNEKFSELLTSTTDGAYTVIQGDCPYNIPDQNIENINKSSLSIMPHTGQETILEAIAPQTPIKIKTSISFKTKLKTFFQDFYEALKTLTYLLLSK